MTKQFLVTVTLLLSVFTTAFAEKKETASNSSTSKKVTLNGDFKKLVVSGNVDVVLYEKSAADVYLFDNAGNTGETTITERNGVLTVKGKDCGEKTLVYIPVNNIKEIEVSGKAKVTSAHPLQTAQLTVFINGDCKVNIQSTGAIDLVEGDGAEMTVEKFITAGTNHS